MPDVVTPIIVIIIAAVGAYYNRAKALPDIRSREICQCLVRFRRALIDIRETGNQIGDLMRTLETPNENLLEILIETVQKQQRNLALAQDEIDGVYEFLEIQSPELSKLHVNIRGKKDRIGLMYSAATATQLKETKRPELEPWEQMVILDKPGDLFKYAERLGKDSGQAVDLKSADMDFEEIVGSIDDLEAFIKQTCRVGDL